MVHILYFYHFKYHQTTNRSMCCAIHGNPYYALSLNMCAHYFYWCIGVCRLISLLWSEQFPGSIFPQIFNLVVEYIFINYDTTIVLDKVNNQALLKTNQCCMVKWIFAGLCERILHNSQHLYVLLHSELFFASNFLTNSECKHACNTKWLQYSS